MGQKLDIVFTLIRLGLLQISNCNLAIYVVIGMFYSDSKLVTSNLEQADVFMEAGGDWDRRNRLKVSLFDRNSKI